MRKISKIILHSTATPEGRHHNVADITRWHRERGFATIGYHYLVLLDGTIEPGRSEQYPGAHTLGHNADSIAVCYVGGCDLQMKPKDTRTPEQKRSLNFLLHTLKQRYRGSEVYGHRNFSTKACPSFDARTEYANL